MSGGQDAQYSTVYDTGTVSVIVNGRSESVSYGQGSSSSSLAQSLANFINTDGGSYVNASYSGATVNLTSKLSGASTNYSLSASSNTNNGYFTGTSFSASRSGGNLTGGTDSTVLYDTGTVTVNINGAPSTANYGQGSTNATVATALASAINANSALVTASSSGNVVSLTSKTNGINTNYSLSVSSASTDGFNPASFSGTPSGMSGGTGGSLYSTGLSYFSDGNIQASSDSVNGNWTYTYDEFNRVKTGVASNIGVGCSWAYDRFGNRWQQNSYGGTCLTPSYTFSGGNNRIDGDSYDAAGNLTRDPGTGMTYVYDADNRLTTAGTYSYVYDAEGRRVAKKLSGAITNEYLLDSSGAQLIELDGSGNVLHTNIFANGQLIGTYKNDNQTYFHFNDWLGNRRYQTNAAGDAPHTIFCRNNPFGDGLSCSGSGTDATEHHFTGKERDSESGLDLFGARYYGSSLGRFMRPDDPFADQHPGDPQSWNLYSYVRNNPLNSTDPSGHECVSNSNGGWEWSGSGETCEDVDAQNEEYKQSGQASATVNGCEGEGAASCLGAMVSDLTSTSSLSEVGVNGILGAQAAEGAWELPGLFRSGWDLLSGWRMASKMAGVRAAGEAGELAAGIIKNTERISSSTGSAAYRVPDILDHANKIIGEVKNYTTTTVSLTNQLKDDIAYAAANGYTVELRVRQGAQLSQSVQQLVNQGTIKLVRF